ncbi:hypothetical protein NLJ89_g10804 [Agrocybe chaxingu]|uniref:Uncharacterized protein n=1 Tax=Agrocybe chaxingu TaxID=84603 RepID=A0A9W8JR33_9AGAR|nr:hypothetical protein NLJ89_g10804 [Agrocybe chaxingu]
MSPVDPAKMYATRTPNASVDSAGVLTRGVHDLVFDLLVIADADLRSGEPQRHPLSPKAMSAVKSRVTDYIQLVNNEVSLFQYQQHAFCSDCPGVRRGSVDRIRAATICFIPPWFTQQEVLHEAAHAQSTIKYG